MGADRFLDITSAAVKLGANSPIHLSTSDPHPAKSEGTFSELLIREQEFLRNLIRTIGVPVSDVPDVLQDANLYLVESQSKYQPGTNFRAWAAQVTRFRCLNYFRARKRRPMVNLSEQALDLITGELVESFDELRPRLKGLDHCLGKLSEDHRKLLDQVYSKGHSLKQIAGIRGASHSAIRKTVSRIRHALRDCIRNWVEE